MSESGSVPPSDSTPTGNGDSKDRHEPRGRKLNDHLPPSRAREVQRAFRLRRAEHLATLEERILLLENENSQLRVLLSLPEAERPKLGSGPTGKGKAIKEGGVPMSERVRARKEARARERRAKGLEVDMDDDTDTETGERGRTDTLSPGAQASTSNNNLNSSSNQHQNQNHNQNPPISLFSQPADNTVPFNYQLPLPFNIAVTPDSSFPDFNDHSIFKASGTPASTSGFSQLFSMFDNPDTSTSPNPVARRSPISPPPPSVSQGNNTGNNPGVAQPDLLTRLKACCHLSDSHVVNDPGLLIFATRLCQSFPCQYGGIHPDSNGVVLSLGDHMLLEDSWRALKSLLDPGGDADGENRINTGRMAAELVIRAAHSRGNGGWISCRYREGMTIKRMLIAGLVQGMGGKFD